MCVCDTNASAVGPFYACGGHLNHFLELWNIKLWNYDYQEKQNDQPPDDGVSIRQNDGPDAD